MPADITTRAEVPTLDEWIRVSTLASGVPLKIEDPSVLQRVARVLISAEAPAETEAPTVSAVVANDLSEAVSSGSNNTPRKERHD